MSKEKMINKLMFKGIGTTNLPTREKVDLLLAPKKPQSTSNDVFVGSNTQKQSQIKFAGYREDCFFPKPVYYGDPFKILADEMEKEPNFQTTVKKWEKDITEGHLPKTCRVLAQTAGTGGGMAVDAMLSTPGHATHAGTIGGTILGGYAQEYVGDIIKIFKEDPEPVKKIKQLRSASENIGLNGSTARISQTYKDHFNGEMWFYPTFSLDSDSWFHGLISPSSKEQNYIKDVLPHLKGKGRKSRKLANLVREASIYPDADPGDILTLHHPRAWGEASRYLGISNAKQKCYDAISHLYSKKDAIADYLEES